MVAAINAKAARAKKPIINKGAPKALSIKKIHATRKPKRTSIGGRFTPLNKSKRRQWKRYRGQGRRR